MKAKRKITNKKDGSWDLSHFYRSRKNPFNIEKEPISAASLGQVHKATLTNGKVVAVKVQRPGLREQITLDLYIVRNIAVWLNENVNLMSRKCEIKMNAKC